MAQPLKRNNIKKLLPAFFIILLILLLLSWLYIFNIYEVGVSVSQLSSLNYVVKIQPKNSVGSAAPFRRVNYYYKVVKGENNVEKIIDEGCGKLTIILRSDSINVKLQIKTDKTQNISLVEIPTQKMEQR